MGLEGYLSCTFDTVDLPGRPASQLVRLSDDERGIRIAVAPADGGELTSFQVKVGRTWHEILYRAMDYASLPPDGWQGRAPTLWPAVGRSYTREQIALWKRSGRKPAGCAVQFGKKARKFPIHGFAMSMPWVFEEYGFGLDDAWVICSLHSSPETRRLYPFDFTLTATYTLLEGRLLLRYDIEAAASNRAAMPFSIGNHISLRMPFTGKGRFEDCSLRTPAKVSLPQTPLCLFSEETRPVKLSRPTSLAHAEWLDAAFGGYEEGNRWFELADPASFTLRVSHREVTEGKPLASPEDMLFVTWGTAEYGYCCPEPWVGRPNCLNERRGRVTLPPGERFAWEITFERMR